MLQFAAAEQLPDSEPLSGPTVEAFSVGTSKMFLNREAELASYGPALAEQFAEGVPENWKHLPSAPHVTVGEIDGRLFAAKTRRFVNTPEHLQMLQQMERAGVRTVDMPVRSIVALSSLESELELSPAIHHALGEEWLQKELVDRGYAGVRYVEPILGVETAATGNYPGQKIMLYEYINRVTDLESSQARGTLGISSDEANNATDLIRLALVRGGILPDDLKPGQVMIDQDKRLYLMDTESYTRLSSPEDMQANAHVAAPA